MKNLLRLSIISVLLSVIFLNSHAQNTSIAINGWRDHTPFNKAIEVAEAKGGLIYCASQFGLYSYSKNNGEINIISRIQELSDFEIKTIRYDQLTGILLIAYENSNIDMILSDKNIVNLPDIKQKNIIGGKHINCILFIDGLAYLGCEFGIVVVDINRREIKDTYYIGHDGTNINVNGLAYDGTYLLAATDSGVYKASYNDPNIFNFNSWTKDMTLAEPDAKYTSATSMNGKFYVVKTNAAPAQDSVLVYDNNQWSPFFNDDSDGGYIDSYNNNLIYRNWYKIATFNSSGVQSREINIYSYSNADIRHGFLDAEGTFWVADFNNGLVLQRWDGAMQIISPNGPRSEASWAMAGSKGSIWVASGALLGDAPNYNIKNGVSHISENTWKTFDYTNDAVYQQMCQTASPAVICVAIDPSDPDHAFVGSWVGGLLEYRKDGAVTWYNESNSSIQPKNLIPGYLLVGGTTFDDEGNLWVVAGGNTNGISVMKKNGTWQNFVINDVSVSDFGFYGLTVDDYGQKWFYARGGASGGAGLCVFKEESLSDPNNTHFNRLTDREGFGALPDMFVRSIAKDKDGSIWIGTDKGVAVIYNPGNVFVNGANYDAQKIIIQQDGYNQYLLETEIVSAIAIDGANRKWFGTYSGGVFLMSADGTKQIHNFNKDNSPLASNSILSIAIDDLTGEVYFGTDKGIISYRGDATKGGDQCSDYYVFPNPIRHDYHGPIAIRGLVANADVKITDVAGNVVYHMKANGGEAIWNGNNFSGERAQTGVYIVYVTNEDGSATCTTKMLFAN